MHLESPGKSLKFKLKIHGLESPWKLQSTLESPWISVLTLSNPDCVSNMKDLQDKIAHVVVELNSRHFLHWMESLKNGKCVLESPWIFYSKKGTNPGINFGRIWRDIKSYIKPKFPYMHSPLQLSFWWNGLPLQDSNFLLLSKFLSWPLITCIHLDFFSNYGLTMIYLQSTEEQAVWVRLMLGCKVVVVEEPHFENSVVNTNTHVGNCHTGYYLQPIKIKLIH